MKARRSVPEPEEEGGENLTTRAGERCGLETEEEEEREGRRGDAREWDVANGDEDDEARASWWVMEAGWGC